MENREYSGKISLAASQYGTEKDYWLKQIPANIEKTCFPATQNLTAEMVTVKKESVEIEFPPTLITRLGKISKSSDYMLHMIMTAGAVALLDKYTYHKNRDIVVGIPIYKQETGTETRGKLLNTALALRNRINRAMSFKQLLLHVRQVIVEANENQNYPIETLVYQLGLDLAPGQFPLFDAAVLLENIHDPRYIEHTHPNIVFSFLRTGESIRGRLEYNPRHYRKRTAEQIARHYTHLLSAVLFDLETALPGIRILSGKEKEELLYEFNRTADPKPGPKTLHGLFEQQEETTPDNIVLVGMVYGRQVGHVQLTYKELNEESGRLACNLRQKGIRPDNIVGTMIERSIEMIVAILGILKAGAAYLPIDPGYPQDRIRYILSDSDAKILLTAQEIAGIFSINNYQLTINNLQLKGNSLAYAIYTSGSTGRPKGVIVEHHSAANMLEYRKQEYNMGIGDISLQLFSSTFDGFITSFFTPVISGAKVILLSEEGIKDITVIKSVITKNRVTHFISVPALYRAIIGELAREEAAPLKVITLAGDRLSPDILEITGKKNGNIEIAHEYGVTESSVLSTIFRHQQKDSQIKIGTPIRNTQIYIIDKLGYIQPLEVPGELCIGGIGLARGYLNRPELTAEKFDRHLWDLWNYEGTKGLAPLLIHRSNRSYKSHIIYKTGDLARWLPDGKIEFLGRVDHQVKIRGYRIELGEIENCLERIDLIKEAAVITRPDKQGEEYLCAYIVAAAAGDIDTRGIRGTLAQRLPDYMVPSHYVPIEKIPLTPTGKVDRGALPEPAAGETGSDCAAPGTILEKKLAKLWAGVLGVKEDIIGIDHDFFEMGGHSLKATMLIADIHKELNVKVPLAKIFRTPTIRELALYIQGMEEIKYASIKSVEQKEYYPLSSAQKRLYILQHLQENAINYNTPLFALLEGNLEKEKLAAVFRHLIQRHESMRTSFAMVNEELVQRIHDRVEFDIEYYQVEEEWSSRFEGTRGLAPLPGEPSARSSQPAAALISSFIRPFDLSRAPLLRVGSIEYNPAVDRHILMLDMHHIITDGTSMIVLIKEIMALYAGKTLPGIRIRYKDFSRWQNNLLKAGEIKKQEEYWKKRFSSEIPVLNLSYDYPRPAIQVYEGGDVGFNIGEEETRALNSLALEEGATLFMLIQAILNVLLWKLSSQEDIIIGTPIAGRRHAEIQQIIGMFVNTLALRNYPHPDKSFNAFLAEVKKQTLDAYENQDYQFEELVENVTVNRDLARDPIFSVMFVLQNMEIQEGTVPEVEIPGLKAKPFPYNKGTSKFDLLLGGNETNGILNFSIQYALKLFKESSIHRYISYIKKIVTSILKDRQVKLSGIQLITTKEKQEILSGFNQTAAKYPQNKTIHELFEEQVEYTPDHTALAAVHETPETPETPGKNDNRSYNSYTSHLSYKELQERANRQAYILKERGIEPGAIVGIEAERSIETLIAIFAILKAGAAYMPIDPEYPEERKQYMLKDSNAGILLKSSAVGTGKSEIRISKSETKPNDQNPNDQNKVSTLIVLNFEHLNFEFVSNFEICASNFSSSELAYIIYTSGSTGKPKGVLVEHRPVVNILTALQKQYPLLEPDAYLLKTSLLFDVSITELFGWFFKGGRLVLLEKGGEKDPAAILETAARTGVTHINFVPSMFNVFIETLSSRNLSRLSALRYIFLAGEALHPELVEKYKKLNTGIRLENIYGPTEATIYAAGYSLSAWNGGPLVPIGKPQPNTRLYILDNQNQVQPVGIPGELCISGTGLARGYLNHPQLTAERFYRSYRSDQSYISYLSYYKTGDLARWQPDGNVQYLGRIDHQVKIRGFRVELGEIESQLLKYPGIKQAVVTAVQSKEGEGNLCAYIEANPPDSTSPDKLREYLSQNLPGYMIPAYFVQLEKIPLTPGGKIDRKALPLPGYKTEQEYVPPADREEKKLAEIWSEVLGIEKRTISMNTRFFELGGHSLKAALLTAKINKEFKVNLPLVKLFKSPTVRELARYIKSEAKGVLLLKDDNLVLIRKQANREKNLFLVHAGSGDVEVYAEFCANMSSKFTCWGIKADRLKNYTPRNLSIKEIARGYTRKIKKVQPRGPYYLAGWCIGGTIAFEIARQLERQEEEIGMISLINALAHMKHLDEMIPASYFAIKEKLQQINKNFIDFDHYKKICKEVDAGIGENAMKGLVRLLNDLGIMLNIPEHRRLEETQVLNPGWLTNGVYQVITSTRLKENQGRLTFKEIAAVLEDPRNKNEYQTRQAQNIIMDMMEHFKLCYPLPPPDIDCYLIPAVLPLDSPPNLQWKSIDPLRFQYRYKTLPSSITANFIVRLLPHKRGDDYWRTGIIIDHEKTRANIRADHYKHIIYIEVTGQGNKRNTLSYIRTTLNIIHGSYSLGDIKPEGFIPLDEKGEVLISYEELLVMEKHKVEKHFVAGLQKYIDVKEVLEGIRPGNELSRQYLEKLADKISRSEIEPVIDELYRHPQLKETEYADEITLLSSRWHRLSKETAAGTGDADKTRQERAAITRDLLQFIKNLEKGYKGV